MDAVDCVVTYICLERGNPRAVKAEDAVGWEVFMHTN